MEDNDYEAIQRLINNPKFKREYRENLLLNQQNTLLQQENTKLKMQYCERTDCVSRIGIGENHKIKVLEEENTQLKTQLAEVNEKLEKIEEYCDEKKEIYYKKFITENIGDYDRGYYRGYQFALEDILEIIKGK